jgi:hypothetical protein
MSKSAKKSAKRLPPNLSSPVAPSHETRTKVYVVPTEFNSSTHDKLPSVSPRSAVEYKSDSKTERANEKYLSNHPELYSLLVYIEHEILRSKPDDIGQFLGLLFHPENEQKIKSDIKLSLSSTEV